MYTICLRRTVQVTSSRAGESGTATHCPQRWSADRGRQIFLCAAAVETWCRICIWVHSFTDLSRKTASDEALALYLDKYNAHNIRTATGPHACIYAAGVDLRWQNIIIVRIVLWARGFIWKQIIIYHGCITKACRRKWSEREMVVHISIIYIPPQFGRSVSPPHRSIPLRFRSTHPIDYNAIHGLVLEILYTVTFILKLEKIMYFFSHICQWNLYAPNIAFTLSKV